MKDVRIIVTGGTIDKIHDASSETLTFHPLGRSQIPRLLQQSRCFEAKLELLMLKDSLDFDDLDRAGIALAIGSAPEEAVVVTHGTGTIDRTAQFLGTMAFHKTVVLTGAVRPFSIGESDAAFNLGGAIVAAQCLPHGVWGTMNGRIFPYHAFRKAPDTLRFDG